MGASCRPFMLKGGEDRAEIRCGVVQFTVKQGVMSADNVVFDPANVRITGRGELRGAARRWHALTAASTKVSISRAPLSSATPSH
jgi:hypothetical protein